MLTFSGFALKSCRSTCCEHQCLFHVCHPVCKSLWNRGPIAAGQGKSSCFAQYQIDDISRFNLSSAGHLTRLAVTLFPFIINASIGFMTYMQIPTPEVSTLTDPQTLPSCTQLPITYCSACTCICLPVHLHYTFSLLACVPFPQSNK